MSDGKTHAIATIVAAGGVGSALFFLSGEPLSIAAAFAGGCLAGLIMTPDLDVRHSTESQRLVRNTGGCLTGMLWSWFWWPYSHLLIPSHRHPLSHLPLLGTAVRLGYAAALPAVIWWTLSQFMQLPALTLPSLAPVWLWAIGGLAVSDTLHTIMDVL